MDKKFIINRVDLGQRVTGYEVFNPAVNGGEVNTMEDLAKYLKMPTQKLLRQLAEYNFLYIQNSSNGYQSKVRLFVDDVTTAVWAYCLYDLEYLSQEKKKRENKEEEA